MGAATDGGSACRRTVTGIRMHSMLQAGNTPVDK
jgi:hypothetical protein